MKNARAYWAIHKLQMKQSVVNTASGTIFKTLDILCNFGMRQMNKLNRLE